MNVKVNNGVVEVTLSRRNLQTLLLKLDVEESERTLERSCEDGFLRVKAEENDVHYGEREPGVMHPREEEKLS